MKERTLFLLDGHALVYRAHYSFISRPLINSKGINTSAINGFVRALWDIIKNEQPSHIAVAFDLSGPTFRNEIYPEYKANREAQPEDITIALPYIMDIVEAFDIPCVSLPNYEADDVIGTLSKQAAQQGFDVYMVTPDKDYGQLVSEKIFMYKPSRKGQGVDILGVPEIKETWQIKRPDQVIDMLGLQGDAVDNIPGVPGIGPKTAQKLLADYDTLEGVIEHADELKGKQKERIIEFQDQARLSKQLATIEIFSPIEFDEEKYRIRHADKQKLADIFRELEFRTLSQQILGSDHQEGSQSELFTTESGAQQGDVDISIASTSFDPDKVNYRLVEEENEIKNLVKELSKQKVFCFDTETTNLDPNLAEIVGISFSWKVGEAFYVPFPSDQTETKKRLVHFKEVLENNTIRKRAQNIKYDALLLKWYDIEVRGYYEDSMLMHYLLEPDLRHNMDYLSETYLNYEPISITTVLGPKGKNQKNMRDIPPEKVVNYASEDADITNQLVEYLEPQLKKEENLYTLYKDIEEPVIKVLTQLEYNGVNLDSPYLNNYSKELTEKIISKEDRIYEKAGTKFNISSPKQVGEILFDHLKIPYRWSKTKTGQYSTDEAKLSELAKDNDIVQDILDYRGLTKLKSTYVDSLPKLVNPRDGRIHSSFNQALASTGRLSSNNPNLQNIPIRTEEGRKIREAFIAKAEGWSILAADYSQIELRLIADMADEPAMLEAFQNKQDIHTATASRVFDVPYDKVTPDQRRAAKTVNFSIIYGAGATNLSQQLDISRNEASDLIKSYFEQYKGLKKYMEDQVAFARENGYVETLLGRRRILKDINSRNGMARAGAERIAINMPIQGTAADVIKLAMIEIDRIIKQSNLQSMMIMQVHDELVFDVKNEEIEKLSAIVETEMANALPSLRVPLLVEVGVGKNWLEAH